MSCLIAFLALMTGILARSATAAEELATTLRGSAAIQFTGTSTLHDFSGHGASTPFVMQAHGGQQWDADVEVPVASLDTGNNWRDAGMRDMLHADECPTLRGHFKGIDPLAVQADGHITFALTICKVTQTVVAQVSEWTQEADSAHFTADFDLSLAAFSLAAPSTLFIKVADTVHATVHIAVNRG